MHRGFHLQVYSVDEEEDIVVLYGCHGLLKMNRRRFAVDGMGIYGWDMFRDLWYYCFLISDPVYLMVDCNI